LTLLVADAARTTAGGLNTDVALGADHAPRLLVEIAGSFSTIAVLLLPLAFAAQRLLQGEGRRVADGLLAAVAAYGTSLAVGLWVAHVAPHAMAAVLTPPAGGGSMLDGVTAPALGYLAPVVACMTAAGVAQHARWAAGLTVLLALNALTALVGGYADALSLSLALLIGWTVAHGTTYALGSPNARPTVGRLIRSLHQLGFRPVAVLRVPEVPPHGPHRYLVHQAEGEPDLDVAVLDREASAAGFFHRSWLRLRLRTAPQRRSLLSLRGALKQEALLAFAAQAAGVRTRTLIATTDLGPDAAVAVYEPLPGRTFDLLAEDELTDPLLADIWRQLKLLHARRIAHRGLVAGALLVDGEGLAHLVDLEEGDIAAGDLSLRMDVAQLLTTVALRVGPPRAVASAFAVLGPDTVGSAVALLQPLALSRGTRLAVKAHSEQDLLARIRDEILRALPEAPVRPVRLERLRPRTLVTVVGSAVAGYYLVLEFFSKDNNPLTTVAQARPLWIAVAAVASVAGYAAATMSFVGFVPERLRLGQAALVQVAGSFANLVTPSGLGGMTVNTRFLQRAGIAPRKAIASVGAGQVVGLVLHVLLVLVFGFLASSGYSSSLTPSTDLVTGLLSAAVLVMLAASIGPVRRWIAAKLQPLFEGVVPRLLDLLQQPGKLAVGIGGQLLISLASAACLYGCVLALGERPDFAAVAVANLIGGAVGAAAPTPGGVGGVEPALSLALAQATGTPYATALTAVLLYRLLTFWLPVLPGWLALIWLQRRKAL
jgi:uncharacterized membrane protein YbhN (UPF0104 family)